MRQQRLGEALRPAGVQDDPAPAVVRENTLVGADRTIPPLSIYLGLPEVRAAHAGREGDDRTGEVTANLDTDDIVVVVENVKNGGNGFS